MQLGFGPKTRGDTLVEVLFATAVFSLVAVSCLAIMNQGAATAQRAFEITLVRNEIDAQAETLRFLNASYVAAYQPGQASSAYSGPARQWKNMDEKITEDNPISSFGSGSTCPTIPDGSFILNARRAMYIDPSTLKPTAARTFSQVVYDTNTPPVVLSSEGIWIEATKVWPKGNNQDNVGYIDFHIRTCWDSPGQSAPVTLGTIVRLYEPH